MPDVVGHKKNDAIKTLEGLGFKVQSFGPGNFTVSIQSPKGGSKAKRGSTVTITGL